MPAKERKKVFTPCTTPGSPHGVTQDDRGQPCYHAGVLTYVLCGMGVWGQVDLAAYDSGDEDGNHLEGGDDCSTNQSEPTEDASAWTPETEFPERPYKTIGRTLGGKTTFYFVLS